MHAQRLAMAPAGQTRFPDPSEVSGLAAGLRTVLPKPWRAILMRAKTTCTSRYMAMCNHVCGSGLAFEVQNMTPMCGMWMIAERDASMDIKNGT